MDKFVEILKGLRYLCKRYGPFELTGQMVGWTHDMMMKVWYNEDFSVNTISKKV